MSDLSVGIIGAGGISGVHAQAWTALGLPTTVTSFAGAEQLAADYGLEVTPSVDALLDRVDVVDILTPTSTHADLALRAIERGKHVICEKPLAVTAEEAQTVVDAAERAGVRLFPAHVVRYFGAYARIKEMVDAGRIGTVAVQRFHRAGAAPSSPWFFSEQAGGGVIRDLMIHDIDQALWLAGPVTTVFATQSPVTVGDAVPTPVTAHVVLTHASGALSHLHAAWGPTGIPFRTSAEVSGSEGRVRYDSAEDRALSADVASDGRGTDYLPPMSPSDSPYYAEIVDFVSALRSGRSARVSPADGVAAVAIAEAAAASIATGSPVAPRTVPVPEVIR